MDCWCIDYPTWDTLWVEAAYFIDDVTAFVVNAVEFFGGTGGYDTDNMCYVCNGLTAILHAFI